MSRILHVFRPRTGGTFGHVRILCAEQAALGHEVAVCGPAGGSDDDFAVPLIDAEIPRDIAPAAAARGVWAVGRAYSSFEPDLIHAHGAQAGVVARLARAARPRAPLVHTPHRYAFEDGSGRSARSLALQGIERSLMPLATRVLCVCEAERAIAERMGARGRARVVHNGIEPLAPSPVPPELVAFAADGLLIVAVSELFARKGVEVLLRAMPTVLKSHPAARLIVAGDGPDRGEVERTRDQLGIADHALLAGHVEGVTGLLESADVYVNPALAEAFPYGVLEAMSAARPCVVTDVGGAAEAIVDGVSGLVVAPGDPGALAEAVDAVLDAPERARALGLAAHERVASRFNRQQMIDGTMAVYAELGIV